MVHEAMRMLERFENNPPPLAGSGYHWVTESGRVSRVANKEAVAALDFSIEEHACSTGLAGLLEHVVEPAARRSTDDTSPG